MFRMLKSIGGSIGLLLMVASLAFGASAEKKKSQAIDKTTGNDLYRPFLINNVFNYYGNNGDGAYNKYRGDNEGFEYPKGGGGNIIYEDGVVWGGFHKTFPDPKVGGSVYRHGIQAGKIVSYGGPTDADTATGDDPTLAKYRVYRVRPDINPHTPFADVQQLIAETETQYINRYESYSDQDIYNQYIQDWNEWPAADGAPYKDVDSNGVYDPGIDIPGVSGADQTLWYVANDCISSRTTYLAGCPPIGLEMQRTIWGYNRAGALGSTIFASTLLINKSGAPVDSMFMVQWADPDLGDAGDDFAGCDVPRSLGYVYNGGRVDATYGIPVPAGGFTFFQGPIVPGAPEDSAVFRLKYRHGFKNLGMSTFVFFTQGFASYADPAQGTNGNLQWYNLMNGLTAANGVPFVDPNTGLSTKFTLSGDPVTGQGWLDGQGGITAQDRRICLVTGPFTMAAGDTQELVVANVGAQGSDRISSVALLRFYSDLAQSAYNGLFNIPNPPPAPQVTVGALDGEVVLSWGDPKTSAATENFVSVGYEFEGYNVYQLPSVSQTDKSAAKRIATFDKINTLTTIFDDDYDPATGFVLNKPVQFGTDIGVSRKIVIKNDAYTGASLVNGTTYYYAVTAYSYNPSPSARPKQLEDPLKPITVIPQWSAPGTRYFALPGDTLKDIVHTGPSDGVLYPVVVNPTALQKAGATYKVFFVGNPPDQTWGIVRTMGSKVDTVAQGATDQTASDAGALIIDGIDFRVVGAPQSFKNFFTVSNGAGAIAPFQQGAFAFNSSGFPLTPDGADRPDGTIQQSGGVLTASQGWGIHTGMNSPTMSLSYSNFLSRVTQSGARWPLIIPYDFEIRFTAAGGKALIPADFTGVADLLIDVPFELWNIGINTPNDPSDDYRLFPYVLDVDNSGTFNLLTQAGVDSVDNGGGGATHSISGGGNDPFTDWIYWVLPEDQSPGQAGYNAVVAGTQADIAGGVDPYLGTGTAGTDVIRRLVLVGWNFGVVSAGVYPEPYPQVGTTFRIISTKPNTSLDSFTLTVPPAVQTSELAEADVNRINVYPNPYFGFNTLEQNKYDRFVTFTHLPRRAIIRVFNLAGILLRTIQKDDATQFAKWDLKNESGFPAAAGMYIVYIDLPDLGKTKTLKLGVIPEQQYIDRW